MPASRPILFSAPMVRAILENRKTQTRRVVKPQDSVEFDDGDGSVIHLHSPKCPGFCDYACKFPCPYGAPGDLLVMLSTWAVDADFDALKPTQLPDAMRNLGSSRFWSRWDGEKPGWAGKNRPGRFLPKVMRDRMPRATNTEVRVERLQEISEKDSIAEGVHLHTSFGGAQWFKVDGLNDVPWHSSNRARDVYAWLWESINGPDSWSANPWVWVVSFKRVQP